MVEHLLVSNNNKDLRSRYLLKNLLKIIVKTNRDNKKFYLYKNISFWIFYSFSIKRWEKFFRSKFYIQYCL